MQDEKTGKITNLVYFPKKAAAIPFPSSVNNDTFPCADMRVAPGSRRIVIFVIKIVPSCASRSPNCTFQLALKYKYCNANIFVC